MEMEQIRLEAETVLGACVDELVAAGQIEEGGVIVLGCSTSEVAGGKIGKASVPELGGVIAGAMLKACEKRSVSLSTLERIATEIEQALQNEMEREIASTAIGELAMDKLKGVDEVAYVRFASVYRQFKDISTFMSELHKLLEEK